MKKILGLDLGTTSIGWALVNETENKNEQSSIIKTGVRVVPLSSDESSDFQKGKATSINADRTLKRGARRSLQRYKLRRSALLGILKAKQIINENTLLAEQGKDTTFSLWELRAKAATEKIGLEDFARVLLAINKKRGYKSNRKAKGDDEGTAIDGMDVANELYEKDITPGQYTYDLLTADKKNIPEYYRSDLQNEFDKIWNAQAMFYPNILTNDLKENLKDKNKGQTWKICEEPFKIVGIKQAGTAKEKREEQYKWRVQGLIEKLELEALAIVLQEINNQTNKSSGLLGEISDRSKTLIIEKKTVGQYLYEQIKENSHTPLKNQVFYRQDYLNEFNEIWKTQSKYHKELTDVLQKEISDIVIFYQRKLKSQKGLISICELEARTIEIDGKKRTIGPRVIPKSSPLFQEFKIWQILNNLEIKNLETKEKFVFDLETRQMLFDALNTSGKKSSNEILKLLVEKPKLWELNYKDGVEGNHTNEVLYKAYKNILELAGYENVDFNDKKIVADIFDSIGIKKELLEFNSDLEGKEFENQLSYQLWHLLYAYEGDNSNTGNANLYTHLKEKFGFEKVYAQTLVNVSFREDYGSLSTRAIKKIMPFLKEGKDYSEACALANYNHSHSLTKEENDKRILKETLELLPKNSLRNPVVEKILNQMVNVINAIIEEYGKPDEVRIELARDLKKGAKERALMTSHINSATANNNKIRERLKEIPPFNKGVRITKNDITKYKLYEELASNGYKTIYTNTYIEIGKLFTKEFDIEHIIPKATLFDDSFSNKTIAARDFNRVKSNKTGIDAVIEKYGENSEDHKRYMAVVEKLHNKGKGAINKAKYTKLLMPYTEIPDGFIERDLRNTQYIAKKALDMLKEVFRTVVPVTGIVTSKLREDWQLVNVLQELNWDKYEKLGLIEYQENKHGKQIPRIIDWTKRNDHRHHAMDALTVAFTKHNHIQYYNYLNARKDEGHKKHSIIYAIEQKETIINDNKKRIMAPPMPLPLFRAEAKKHLDSTLVSFKAKNKVVTRNINKTKKKGGMNSKIELTPRGQLHKETVYGKSKIYEGKLEKVGVKFDKEKINRVAKLTHKEALIKRLTEFDNDPKKAFGGKNALAKNPIYIDANRQIELPEMVKLTYIKDQYTIRKAITPDLKIEKVVDLAVQKILQQRLDEFNGDKKKAFVNLEENPIWLNKEKGIKIKRVAITGVSNAEALHNKKDHLGNEILTKEGNPIPVDFVSTGNNHHVAIYKDESGKLHEKVVSFYEAVARKNEGLNVIDKGYRKEDNWEFLFTMKQNEYFVFPNEETGFKPNDIELYDSANAAAINLNLFRVQKISTKNYLFTHHLETQATTGEILKNKKQLSTVTYNFIQSPSNLDGIVKVRVNHIGKIVKVGEY